MFQLGDPRSSPRPWREAARRPNRNHLENLITKKADEEALAKKRRIDALFEKYPLKPLAPIETSQRVEWDKPESNAKGIISRFRVAYKDPEVSPNEIIKYFSPDIMKHCREIGWEVNFDDYDNNAIRALKDPKEPLAWTIFVMLKRNTASHKDIHFGAKAHALKPLVEEASRVMKRTPS